MSETTCKTERAYADLIPSFLVESDLYFVALTDLDGKYKFVNETFKKKFYYLQENFIGTDSLLTVIAEDQEYCLLAVAKCLSMPNHPVKVDLRKPDNVGKYIWSSWEFTLLNDALGFPLGILCIGHDTSESKQAYLQAKAHADRASKLIDEISEGFCQFDHSGKLVLVNTVAAEIIGSPQEAVLYKTLKEVFGEDNHEFIKKLEITFENRSKQVFEYQWPSTDLWYKVAVYPSMEGYSIFFRDITQEKEYVDMIKRQRGMLKAIYNSTSEAYTFVDTDFIIRYNNLVAKNITKEIFGRQAEPGESALDYVVEECRKKIENYYNVVLKGESISEEQNIGCKWYLQNMNPVYDDNEQIVGISHNIRDITRRKEKEMLLDENRQMLKKTIEAIPHPLIKVDYQMNISYVNEEFCKVFGFSESEILNLPMTKMLPIDEYVNIDKLFAQYLSHGGGTLKLNRYMPAFTKDGRKLMFAVSLNSMEVSGKMSSIVILQDVTALKLHQDTIVRQNKVLKKIAWDQSHGLRKPLANVLGLCNLLIGFDDLNECEKKLYITYLYQETQKMDNIIHKIVKSVNKKNLKPESPKKY